MESCISDCTIQIWIPKALDYALFNLIFTRIRFWIAIRRINQDGDGQDGGRGSERSRDKQSAFHVARFFVEDQNGYVSINKRLQSVHRLLQGLYYFDDLTDFG